MAERRRRLGTAGGLAGGALMVTVAAAAMELPVLLWVSLGLAVGAIGVAVGELAQVGWAVPPARR
jgi:hypothetical protein